LSSKMLSKIHGGVVLTSATLTTQSKMVENDYSYYANSMGLNKIIGKPVTMEYPQNSPYDYSDHTILYCPRWIFKRYYGAYLYFNWCNRWQNFGIIYL